MNEERAYEILGLECNSSKEIVEEKYGVLVKRLKNGGEYVFSEEVLADAYYFLTNREGYELRKAEALGGKKVRAKGSFAASVEYYKVHIILGLLLVSFFGYMAFAFFSHVDPDISMMFLPSALSTASNDFEEKMKSVDEGIEKIEAVMVDGGEYSEARVSLSFAAGDIDIYFMNKAWLDRYIDENAFVKLDDLLEEKELSSDRFVKMEADEYREAGIYAVRVTDSELLVKADCGFEKKGGETVKKDMYMLIAKKSKRMDNAVKIFSAILGSLDNEKV